jgi:hypothetical protein
MLRLKREHLREERGAHFIELAIALPVFLALLLALFDLARISLGYSAVRAGTYHGVRRGIGARRPINNSFINGLYGAAGTGTVTTTSLNASNIFKTPTGNPTWYAKNSPPQIYRNEAVAVANAYHIISASFGQLHYPCTDRKNCVACTPTRDKDAEYVQLFCPIASGGTSCAREYRVKYLGMRCTLNVPIVSSNIAWGWLPEYLSITETIYISMENYANAVFDPN